MTVPTDVQEVVIAVAVQVAQLVAKVHQAIIMGANVMGANTIVEAAQVIAVAPVAVVAAAVPTKFKLSCLNKFPYCKNVYSPNKTFLQLRARA